MLLSHLQHHAALQYADHGWSEELHSQNITHRRELNMQTTISNQLVGGVAALALSVAAFALTAF